MGIKKVKTVGGTIWELRGEDPIDHLHSINRIELIQDSEIKIMTAIPNPAVPGKTLNHPVYRIPMRAVEFIEYEVPGEDTQS